MKHFISSIIVATALLISVLPVQAKQYCHETLTQGENTIYLTCEKLSEGSYKIVIEADVELSGLGGSFMELSDGNHDLREFMTTAADKKSLTIAFTSAKDPRIYTPLYVMMPGEVNFGELNDIEWGLCNNDQTEYTITVVQPADGGTIEASVAKATYGTEVTLTATPDAGMQLDKWSVTDAEDNAVAVKNGKFNMPAANVTVTATFRDELHLTPATFYGQAEFDGTNYDWSVTRNIDQTLTFAISWDRDLEGVSPQINIRETTFRGMQAEGRTATYSTTDTYEDDEEVAFFFYIAYAGNAARIDVNYIVGSENENPNPGSAVENTAVESRAMKAIFDGKLVIIRNGQMYNANGVAEK